MVKKLVVDVPDDLKDGFKIYCTKNGTSIHAEIIEFIQATLDGTQESADTEPTERSQETAIKTDSSQEIQKTETRDMLRKALGLRPKEKRESDPFDPNDPLNIGFG